MLLYKQEGKTEVLLNVSPKKLKSNKMINLINDEVVLSKMIEGFKLDSFDQIRIPGGTSKDGSFYAGILVAKYDDVSNKTYFVLVPYNSNYHNEGEANNNKRSDEFPEQTALRELFEETGIMTSKEKLILAWEKSVKDKRPWMFDKFHRKQVFVTDDFDDSHYFTYTGPNRISAETMPPICISADSAIDVIYGGHLNALKGAIDKLIRKDINYYNSLQGLVDKLNKRITDFYISLR